MTKTLLKDNFSFEYKTLSEKVSVLERMVRVLSSLTEINTTGLTDEQIDSAVIATGYPPPNGKIISDPINNLVLLRQNGKWKRAKLE